MTRFVLLVLLLLCATANAAKPKRFRQRRLDSGEEVVVECCACGPDDQGYTEGLELCAVFEYYDLLSNSATLFCVDDIAFYDEDYDENWQFKLEDPNSAIGWLDDSCEEDEDE
ncbi:expressed unknown protein [Seminavis robusta]|uniref:Uncharacterized protein n=1 Tax=Seminavis robusta TaxID=568900 RepID=A0A9N8DW09_9STRA|nr:expressed unknown protein [Seminavis robusta]|eukprot:Sro415_g138470.1 n/a (113) ;mRNA; r:16853-17191